MTVRKAQADAEGIEILADAAAAGFTKKTLASAERFERKMRPFSYSRMQHMVSSVDNF